jgi:uncharacterized membrane protein YczE
MILPTQIRSLPHKVTLLLTGWVLIAVSVSAVIRAGLGAGPLDLLNTGLAAHLHIQVGTASWITTTVLVGFAFVLGMRPKWTTFAGAFFIGLMINAAIRAIPAPSHIAPQALMLVSALAVLYFGIALVVVADLGAGAIDLVMFALHHKGVSLRAARLTIEAGAAITGVLLGGSAGVATVLIAITVGPALQHLIPRVAVMPFVAPISTAVSKPISAAGYAPVAADIP